MENSSIRVVRNGMFTRRVDDQAILPLFRFSIAAAILLTSSWAFCQEPPEFWDPELDAMGASWQAPALSPGQEYWKLISAEFIDENESGGLHHMFYKCLDLGGTQLGGIRIVQEWSTGFADALTKAPPDWGDIAMYGSGWCPTYPNPRSCPPGPYTGYVGDGRPSYRLAGCGMPANHHVCYEMIFQLRIAGGAAATSTPTSPAGPTNTPPPSGANLLTNPGAETGDYSGWVTGGGMKIDPDVHLPSPLNHSGSHRFGHSVMDTLEAYMYQQVSVTSGETHEAGLFLCEMDGTDETMEVSWIDGPYGGTENLLYSTTPGGTYPSWHGFSGARFTPTAGTVTLILRFHHTAATGIAAWHVDDIYLKQVGGEPGPSPTPTAVITPGAPAWKLSYARQYGQDLTAGVAGQAELFATWEDGDYADIGMTNDANPSTAIFGYTGDASNDPYTPGNSRVTFNPPNDPYDFHVYDPTTASDRSPDCHWLDSLPHYGHYRFEFWWRKVADDALYEFFPTQPVYHYDLVNGFNNPPNEPPGFSSDDSDLSDWAEYQAQTFVVPANINRIIGAKCFGDKGYAQKFRMVFSIRQGSPTGPQVGPSVTAREKDSNEFPNVKVAWGMDDVQVTPGGTYALRVEVLGGGGMNVHATWNNNYTQGMLYNGGTEVPGRDMIAVVVGARKIDQPTPATPTPSPTQPVIVPTPTLTPTAHHGDLMNPALDDFANPNAVADYWQNWAGMGSPAYLAEGGWWRHTQDEGARSQRWWADGASYDAGIRQEVAAVPGATYRFTAWMHHYQAQTGNGPVNFYVGIDPNGGTELLQVIWSDPVPRSDNWEQISVEVAATGNSITVYGRVNAEGPSVGGERDTFMDDTSLVVVSEPATSTPTPTLPPIDTPVPTNTMPPTPSMEERPIELFGFGMGWQRSESETPFYQPRYDLNTDTMIDEDDLYLFLAQWPQGILPVPTSTATETPMATLTHTPRPATPTNTPPPPPTPTETPSDIIYENHFEAFQDFNASGSFNPGDGSGGLIWSPPPTIIHTVDPPIQPWFVHWGGDWYPFDYLENENGRTGSCQEIRVRYFAGHAWPPDGYLLRFQFTGANALAPGNYEASVWVKTNYAASDGVEYIHPTIGHGTSDDPIAASYYTGGAGVTSWTRITKEFSHSSGDRYIFLACSGIASGNPDGYVAGYFDDMVIRKIW